MKPSTPDSLIALTRDRALDETKLKKRVFWNLLSSPWTLWPFVAGMTLLMALWAFSVKSGLVVFSGIALVLGALGVFLTRLVLGSESLIKREIGRMQDEAQAAREQALDNLERQLVADGDPRTEAGLRDLRALAKAFEQGSVWTAELNPRSLLDILGGVEQLFKRCVLSLKKTLDLWYTAQRMATEAARQPILEQRERIIDEVAKSTRQLGLILAGIQSLGAGEGSADSELVRIREELDRSLEVARVVEKRMQALDREIDTSQLPPGE